MILPYNTFYDLYDIYTDLIAIVLAIMLAHFLAKILVKGGSFFLRMLFCFFVMLL